MLKDKDYVYIVMRDNSEDSSSIPVGVFRMPEAADLNASAYTQAMVDAGVPELTFRVAITQIFLD